MIEISHPEAMQQEPLVSVLMLAYRHEPYIAEAIEGVLSQRCDFPIELIIAEDCSPDRTLAIAQDYLAQYPNVIRIVTGKTNIGMMPNFYRALEMCRGKYIAFCEGDDYWCHPGKLSKQAEILEASENVGMVHGAFLESRFIDGNWHLSETHWHAIQPDLVLSGDVFAQNLSLLVIRTCSLMVRASLLYELRMTSLGREDFGVGDVQIVVYCAAQRSVAYIPDVIAVYRHVPGSATRSGLSGVFRICQSVSRIHVIFGDLFSARDDFDKFSAIPFHTAYAKAAFRMGDKAAFDEAFQNLRSVSSSYPQKFGLLARWLVMRSRSATCYANKCITWYRKCFFTIRMNKILAL